ncbi:hypothetical protein TGPRC2_253820 [Toxoplasma gondii TgCatPRC2]|uniref:Immune mapped protein 2 N-terminal domain-containing protein n=15 Tax=Toxoplasma gondii TaxID=5811 RepID=B9PWR9_TOXGV|nr:hypothetical protein TGME49_253820 [Toxoplasma gondii ME49]EPR59019.1 hypothetical protein TGGT1_253820 [Toxoplasma gondii GT1]ESS30325.1 hypothetical protein TGVEG_253820 [Toxoplasma gondii VEG]KAF4645349.1 hypothetical protein TGRH88_004530 [Toxoplasma gondii]KFG35598.1 hypothetical protein TGDOM2_253820 [Toxoplasma gondii GAB2-2007-GAL-DOM2]KFG47004.1 hypothetical protein TGP89_253820 [Toxoplasma gondii p89]KFG52958.1 hypothetical protein TGFOU_253820 [Toxoplasma gondii FOU]KFG60041.1 |eukprot:XP_002369438.1 hypothetical protein TGME49_253820 [Toxoplasma gondii ME49]
MEGAKRDSSGGMFETSVQPQDTREMDENLQERKNVFSEGAPEEASDQVMAPPVRSRRRSTVLGPENAGLYLEFDDAQKKWIGQWHSGVLEDAVAFMRPTVKVPQFKYTQAEKVVLKSGKVPMRDERKDFLEGLCLFVKLAKEYRGDILIISKADLDERDVMLLGLTDGQEIRSYNTEDVFCSAKDLVAVAVVPTSSISFKAKTMDVPIFVGIAEREGGFAVSFANR